MFDPGCLALSAGQMGHAVLFFLVVVNLPKYMKDVLKFNIKQNGMLSSLPYVSLWICGIISGVISDYLIEKEIVSLLNVRKIYTTIGKMIIYVVLRI